MNGLTPKLILRRTFVLVMGAIFVVVIEEGVSSLWKGHRPINSCFEGLSETCLDISTTTSLLYMVVFVTI